MGQDTISKRARAWKVREKEKLASWTESVFFFFLSEAEVECFRGGIAFQLNRCEGVLDYTSNFSAEGGNWQRQLTLAQSWPRFGNDLIPCLHLPSGCALGCRCSDYTDKQKLSLKRHPCRVWTRCEPHLAQVPISISISSHPHLLSVQRPTDLLGCKRPHKHDRWTSARGPALRLYRRQGSL